MQNSKVVKCEHCKDTTMIYKPVEHTFIVCEYCYGEKAFALKAKYAQIPESFLKADFKDYFKDEQFKVKQTVLLDFIRTREKTNWIINSGKSALASAYAYFLVKEALLINQALGARCISLTSLLLLFAQQWQSDENSARIKEIEETYILYISNFDAALIKENTTSQGLRDMLQYRQFSEKINLISTTSSKEAVFTSLELTPSKTIWMSLNAN